MSVEELTAYLGIKRDTVYKWITRRNMPAHKVGRLWKFKREEVDDWVRSGAARDLGK
ncbi:MAG TPA: helix-turn-helix domain-containing protein [Acidobacteriaceae bacterium]|nr:helix-turn-helix domain-containing protein [Acidobacteriaceae bacterium]